MTHGQTITMMVNNGFELTTAVLDASYLLRHSLYMYIARRMMGFCKQIQTGLFYMEKLVNTTTKSIAPIYVEFVISNVKFVLNCKSS